jgi:phosphatidylglycerol:prolipoprotein diacylglycerol transferase
VEVDGVRYIQVHPTFLYESVWNLFLLIFILWFTKKRQYDGQLFLIYLLGYGLGRVWIEALRTDQLLFFGTSIPVSQMLSAVLVLSSAVILFLKRHKKEAA